MADHGIFLGFGFPARGREEGAIKSFQELLGFLGSQMQQGNVESFEPVFLQPHGGDLGGFVLVQGDRARLDAMAASPEFQRLLLRGQTTVDGLGVINCVLRQELQRQMGSFFADTADLR